MAQYDSADLLARIKVHAKQPTVSQDMSDIGWYVFLGDAQESIMAELATHVPEANYSTPTKMTTTDSGLTYFIDDGSGGVQEFFGWAEVRESRAGSLVTIGAEFDPAVDFAAEGFTLRVPDGKTRTFADGPYVRYVAIPGLLSAAVEPVLKPNYARRLIIYRALQYWAARGGLRDPAPYMQLEQREAWGDPNSPGSVGIIAALKSQYYGAYAVPSAQGKWWASGDLG